MDVELGILLYVIGSLLMAANLGWRFDNNVSLPHLIVMVAWPYAVAVSLGALARKVVRWFRQFKIG